MLPLFPIIAGIIDGGAVAMSSRNKYEDGGLPLTDEEGRVLYQPTTDVALVYAFGGETKSTVNKRKADEIRVKKGIYPEIKISYVPTLSERDISLIGQGDSDAKFGKKFKVSSSQNAFDFFKALWDKDLINLQEEMVVLLLNNNNVPIGFYKTSKGGITATIADVQIISSVAIQSGAKGIILAHNHPSGGVNPSNSDKGITERVKKALELFDIKLLDHLIVTEDSYFSFADEGLIYEKGGVVSVDGHSLVYETWSKIMGGNGVSGTIRTVPQNYYVATIDEDGEISFEGLEVNTRDISQDEVKRLWKEGKIKKKS